jgi:PBP1b-binding outer membrane lipoprotein LpoB
MNILKRTPILALLIVTILVMHGCAGAPKKPRKTVQTLKLGNFDRAYVPNEAPVIAHMISIVQPELDANARHKIANDISHASKKYNVEPQIMVALIDTESNFNFKKISSTGDLSLAQINVEVWNVEFKRMKLPLIKKEELVKEDQAYAMKIMAQILSIIKSRYSKKDRRWYARYHSNTTRFKVDYLEKIEVRMKMLSESQSAIAMK